MKLFALPTASEWILFALIFLSIGLFIVVAEFLRSKYHGSPEITRKLVHILTGVLIFFAPELFHSGIPAILLALAFILINFVAIRSGILKGMHGTHRASYGTVYYPVSLLILVLIFWDYSPQIISLSIAVLALSDAAAAIVGENLKSPHNYQLTSDKKSLEGSLAMFLTTAVIVILGIHYFSFECTLPYSIITAIALALFVTAWEAISSKGFDNLTVPLSAALMFHFFFFSVPDSPSEQMIIGIVLASIVAYISYRLKFLTSGGSVATFLLATIIFGLGGIKWSVPILTFFVASSLLSKIGKSRKEKLESIFDKTDRRDEGQVAANGGVAGILVLLWYVFPDSLNLYLLYVASLTAVTADTWGTEIGTLFRWKPVSIVSLKKVEPGTSGGVSIAGIAGGLIGAALVIASAMTFDTLQITQSVFLKLLFASVVASLVDSILGATLQIQYVTVDGIISEKTIYNGIPTQYHRGWIWLDNDIVNWLCAATGVLTMYLLL